MVREACAAWKVEVVAFQSNHEGALIDFIQEHRKGARGIIVNPGALTHTSYALHDCLKSVAFPVDRGAPLERPRPRGVPPRRASSRPPAAARSSGLGPRGYLLAAEWLCAETATPLPRGADDAAPSAARLLARRGTADARPRIGRRQDAPMPRVAVLMPARDAAPHRARGGRLHPPPDRARPRARLRRRRLDGRDAPRSSTRSPSATGGSRVVRGPGEGIARALNRGLAACDAERGRAHGRGRRRAPRAARAAARGARRGPGARRGGLARAALPAPRRPRRDDPLRRLAERPHDARTLVRRDLFVEAPLVHPAAAIRRDALDAAGGLARRRLPGGLRPLAPPRRGGRRARERARAPPRLARVARAAHPHRSALRARAPRGAQVRLPRRGAARRPARGGALGRGRDRARPSRTRSRREGIRVALFVEVDRRKIGRHRARRAGRSATRRSARARGLPLLVAVGAPGARELIRAELGEGRLRGGPRTTAASRDAPGRGAGGERTSTATARRALSSGRRARLRPRRVPPRPRAPDRGRRAGRCARRIGSETLYGVRALHERRVATSRACARPPTRRRGSRAAPTCAAEARHALPGRGGAPPAALGRAGVGVPRLRRRGARPRAARPGHAAGATLDAAIYEAFVGALKAVDRAGLFGRGAERAFLTRERPLRRTRRRPSSATGLVAAEPGARRSSATGTRPRPRRSSAAVNRAPRRERMRIWLALYEDLYMEWQHRHRRGGARARASRPGTSRRSSSGSGRRSCRSSSTSSPTTASPPPFDHTRGLETREVWLAGSALFLVRRIGARDREGRSRRLQRLVGEFVERDRRLRVASTLAENTARVLHELRPRRFPPTRDGPADLQAPQPGAVSCARAWALERDRASPRASRPAAGPVARSARGARSAASIAREVLRHRRLEDERARRSRGGRARAVRAWSMTRGIGDLADAARAAVARVAEERRAEVGEVDADLVGAAGLGRAPRRARRAGAGAQRPVAGRRGVAARVHAAEPGAGRVLPERRVDRARRPARARGRRARGRSSPASPSRNASASAAAAAARAREHGDAARSRGRAGGRASPGAPSSAATSSGQRAAVARERRLGGDAGGLVHRGELRVGVEEARPLERQRPAAARGRPRRGSRRRAARRGRVRPETLQRRPSRNTPPASRARRASPREMPAARGDEAVEPLALVRGGRRRARAASRG